ncbi:hypothetical protein KEM60_03299 [Austwickia sp. TVS 96-490-7B]|uniref:M50 family metallopeptidase n=1 Tax=Austwickia sp. TVS 96-490-7B TaxID=2830843 RepID=UPI001C575F28|nr:M50 family metallopeptidase [Austwickia sp. TVS 96-490-7B]MBW3087069.1 hypothetical protein [Austwickia sp. TVS 96-490-7B]
MFAAVEWWTLLRDRIAPGGYDVQHSTFTILLSLTIAAVVAFVPTIWQSFRLVVTLVHELGHAGVGVACGRRFTGFVVSGDGSGHAVTSGRPRGFGRIATTWAGYPAPAFLGSLLVWISLHGWAAPALSVILLVLLAVVFRVRSALTLLVMVASIGALGWLWWSGSAAQQGNVLLGSGCLLIVGAWRHLGAVWRSGRGIDDHRVLAQLTWIPAQLWVLSWVAVCALATWPVITAIAAILGVHLPY